MNGTTDVVTHQQLGWAIILLCVLAIAFIVWRSFDKRVTRQGEVMWREAWEQQMREHPAAAASGDAFVDWPETGLARYLDQQAAAPQPQFTPRYAYPVPASRVSGPLPAMTAPMPVAAGVSWEEDADNFIEAMRARTDHLIDMLNEPISG